MSEKKKWYEGFEFKYILKDSKYDTDHLIVVFSGFGGRSDFTYDFKSSLVTNRSYVLWIKDDFFFNNKATYYLDPLVDKDGSKPLESAIISFINDVLNFLGVCKSRCTLLGASKGGASALFYGFKYNFKNILVSAPVIKIGSSVAGLLPKQNIPRASAFFMLGKELCDDNIRKLDRYILDTIEKDLALDKNIYLFVSSSDNRYKEQQSPFLYLFLKYDNFNLLETNSFFIQKHQDVTRHNTPVILNILGLLAFNAPPFFNGNKFKFIEHNTNIEITKEPVLHLKSIKFCQKGYLYPEGVFFLRGLSCANYEDLNYYLILKSEHKSYTINLAKGNSSFISRSYFKDGYVSYDKALFCSKSYAGLNLEKIECGLYEIHIKILMRVGDVKELNLPKPELSNKNIHVSNKITQRIFYEEGILFYEKTKNDSFIARFLKKMIP